MEPRFSSETPVDVGHPELGAVPESAGMITVWEPTNDSRTPKPIAPITASHANGSKLLAGLPQIDSPLKPTAHKSPRLQVVRGERLGILFQLLEGKNFIGRTADQPIDIDLDGQEPVERIWTSRQHAVITLDKQHAVLEDLNSLNGTFVNRVRIHAGQKRILQPGDIIQVGTVQLRYLA